MALLDSTLLYHGSTSLNIILQWLYFSILESIYTLPWLYFILLYYTYTLL